jgi:hypothetical protein
MTKLRVIAAAVLWLVAFDRAIADDQVPAEAPIPAPPGAQSPAPPPGVQCNDFPKLAAEAQKRRSAAPWSAPP